MKIPPQLRAACEYLQRMRCQRQSASTIQKTIEATGVVVATFSKPVPVQPITTRPRPPVKVKL